MNISHSRSGFVLPITLLFTIVVAIIVSAVVGYVSHSTRMTRIFLAKDRCRLVAQSAIENAKGEIQQGFCRYIAENFASIQIAPGKAKAYNWFNAIGSDQRTIGSPSPVTIFNGMRYPLRLNGCDIWVGIGKRVEHETDGAVAVIPIVATAVYTYPDGLQVSSTIQERIVFGTGQSQVFDYAYFVNNYGWMSGPFTLNGDVRANGNFSLKASSSGGRGSSSSGPVVNGFVYAARNNEIQMDGKAAAGTVTVSSTKIYGQATYRETVGNRARYDTGNLDEDGSYNAPAKTENLAKPTFDASGAVVSGTVAANSGNPIINEDSDAIEMPFIADLAPYIDYAREQNGTLQYPAVTYKDSCEKSHTLPAGTVQAYNDLTKAGPSGDASLADAGSLLLVGTDSNPIVLNGPVVVAGDVIIKGTVKGQGTIYAGRNIHIIGDIKYKDPPTWTHTKTGGAAKQEQAANESDKTMLGLMAKGNIVVGDATSSSIASSVNGSSTIRYSCDECDSAIGYPSKSYSSTAPTITGYDYWGRPITSTETSYTFGGNYTATEQINGLSAAIAATAPGGYDRSSGHFGKVRGEIQTYWEGNTQKKRYVFNNAYDRCYYETICDNIIISRLKETVSQIDAVMYNNHGAFGSLGANFQINGALVCRDEGFSANGGSFNWDMRLRRKKDSGVVAKMGLPKGANEPYTSDWMEIPDALNPLYPASNSGGTK